MKLGDLINNLYRKRGKEIKNRQQAEDLYDSTETRQKEDRFGEIESIIIEKQEENILTKERAEKRKKNIVVMGGILLALAIATVIVVVGYFKIIGSAFREEKIIMNIEGQSKIQSPKEVTYKFTIKNDNRISMNNIVAQVVFPEQLKIINKDEFKEEGPNKYRIDMGNLSRKTTKEYELTFQSLSSSNKEIYIDVVLEYQPSNFSSRFKSTYQQKLTILASPVLVNLIPTKQAASGESIEVRAVIRNNGDETQKGLQLKMIFPEGFRFIESSPERGLKDTWMIDSLEPNQQKEITIKGMIEGFFENTKTFKAFLYANQNQKSIMSQSEAMTQIITDRVEIFHIKNKEELYAGNTINYKIRFKNTSDVPLRDLVLTETINSKILDKKAVKVEDGYYDSEKNEIVWRASEIPKLKVLQPKEEGEVNYSIKVLEVFPAQSQEDKNFSIEAKAGLHSLDIDSPIGQNKEIFSAKDVIKVNSKIIVRTTAVYNDGEIPNQGPLPMKVGEETTFTFRINLLNTSNDLETVELKTGLPSGIRWTEKYMADGKVEYNERTNELTWKLEKIPGSTGFLYPVKVLVFQVGVTPSENQKNGDIALLNGITVTAKDNFTEKDITYYFSGFSAKHISDIGNKVIE